MKLMPPSRQRLRKIRLVLMDVDGVLTDGSLVYTKRGEEAKEFNVKDGYGIVLGRENGLTFGIITGKSSVIVRRRAKDLGIRVVHQGVKDKEKVYAKVLKKLRLTDDEVAFIGDDEPDLPVLKRVGFSAAPADCVDAVRRSVMYVCKAPGGRGAVREIIEMLLRARRDVPRRSGS